MSTIRPVRAKNASFRSTLTVKLRLCSALVVETEIHSRSESCTMAEQDFSSRFVSNATSNVFPAAGISSYVFWSSRAVGKPDCVTARLFDKPPASTRMSALRVAASGLGSAVTVSCIVPGPPLCGETPHHAAVVSSTAAFHSVLTVNSTVRLPPS